MNRSLRFGVLILLTIYASTSLVACANNTLQMTDRDVLIPSVRVSLPVVPKPESGDQAEATWSGVTLDGEVSYLLTGEDRQTLPAAEQVSLDKVTVAGPATVKTRARALDVTATARTGLAIGDAFTLEPVVGIQVVNVDLELVSPTVQGTDVSTSGGIIVGDDGSGKFAAYQPVGALDGAWFKDGLQHTGVVEVHLVVNDHGPLIEGRSADMLSTYRGGCSSESIPAPMPHTARADGKPGPNQCRLVQFSIFTAAGS